MPNPSRTQIVATIGPACGSRETLSAMIAAGLDIARINCAWGDVEQHREYINNLRAAALEHQKSMPVIYDLPGPRVQEDREHHFGGESGLTERDRAYLDAGLSFGVEYFALSYVSSENDVLLLKSLLSEKSSAAKVVAKIEREPAVHAINDIVLVSDAIMIARGDLGNEVPIEQIPFIEKNIIQICNAHHVSVIVATEMMSSMIEHQRPSRADVTDVAFAVSEGADAVMLSNETATGSYPVGVVAAMERILLESEKHSARPQNPLIAR